MKTLFRFLGVIAFLPIVSTSAHAYARDGVVGSETRAFSAGVVDDEVLRAEVATGWPSFTHSFRRISDADSISLAQQFGQNSRIAMDGWWSQTGAALIANNLIANGQ